MKKSLRRKIAINLSLVFSLLFGIVFTVIYISFNNFRQNEFKDRFVKRLDFSINDILQSKEFTAGNPIIFSETADNILLDENIMIFDSRKQLLYSTIKDHNVTWDQGLLENLDQKNTLYFEQNQSEVYAALRNIRGKNYYIITTATDTSGQLKLVYLKYVLVFSYILSILLIWFLSYYIIGKFLEPLQKLKVEISEVTAHKLTTQIPVETSDDEIGVLAESFNTMIVRLNDVFQSQKDFTASASHEIRTPLTRMAFQIENLIKSEKYSPETLSVLSQISKEIYQLSDLTNSLLILAKFDRENIQSIYQEVRIDEVIFDAYHLVEKNFPDLKMEFQISENSLETAQLTILGVKPLLEIVFINLFKNAALYGENNVVIVNINESKEHLVVDVISYGKTISVNDQKHLFDSFIRGSNSQNISGSGLGLRIAQRILEYHKSTTAYQSPAENQNVFQVTFPI